MKKTTLFLFIILSSISFLQMDCKDDEPIKPPDNTPPDTTSHNFTFTTYTFGGSGGSSYFKDVAIINDSDIWAVGEIYSDSSMYNAANWDGKKWGLRKITVNFRNNLITPSLNGVFTFAASDIWFIGSLPIHGDGQNWDIFDLRLMTGFENVSLSKAWGVSSSNIYFVGGQGSIIRYNGTNWTKLESETTLDIQDIWGATNTSTGQQEILAVASNKFLDQGKKLLQIKGSTVSTLSDSGLSWSLSGVWFVPGKQYYVVGDGLYPSATIGPIWNRVQTFPAYYKDAIRGSSWNNVVVCGSNGLLSHFNGATWKHYMNDELPSFVGRYYGAAISSNSIVAVGYANNEAIATIGRKK